MFITPHKKLNKRGFTLVELTMVMAITAIISVMIVSFSTLISAQTRKNNLRADFLESVMTLRTDLQKQFAEVDNGTISEAYIDKQNNNIIINSTTILSNWKVTYKYIESISFEIHESKILKVTAMSSLSESQTFTLISKVG